MEIEEQFARFEDWQSCCQRNGYEGPYQISGQPHLWQYVRPQGATVAMWNWQREGGRGRGYVWNTEPQTSDQSKE